MLIHVSIREFSPLFLVSHVSDPEVRQNALLHCKNLLTYLIYMDQDGQIAVNFSNGVSPSILTNSTVCLSLHGKTRL